MHPHRWLVTVGLLCGLSTSAHAQEGAEVLSELSDPEEVEEGFALPD